MRVRRWVGARAGSLGERSAGGGPEAPAGNFDLLWRGERMLAVDVVSRVGEGVGVSEA